MAELDVTDNPDRTRFEARRDGELVGWIDYADLGERIVLQHAETVAAHRGAGVGGATVKVVLDQLRERPDPPQVVPTCGFVAHWITEHPEYAPLTRR